VSIPNRFDIVQAVNAAHPQLIRTNTRATVAEFLWRAVAALSLADPNFGFLSKLPAENGVEIPGVGKVSIDAIAYRGEHNVVDIMGSAGDGPGKGSIYWGESDKRRPSSVWVQPVPFPGGEPVPPTEPPTQPPTPPSPGNTSDILKRIGELEQQLKALEDRISGAALDASDAKQIAVMLGEVMGRLRLQADPTLPDDQAISTNNVWGHAHRIKARIVS
jgi:hypothetical protein